MKVNQCMTSDVATVSPDDTIERAAQIMGSIDAGVLPVANGERLVGIVSLGDLDREEPEEAGRAMQGITRPTQLHNQ